MTELLPGTGRDRMVALLIFFYFIAVFNIVLRRKWYRSGLLEYHAELRAVRFFNFGVKCHFNYLIIIILIIITIKIIYIKSQFVLSVGLKSHSV